jgi:hypothetical protein
MRDVEVMAVGPWFPQTAGLLRENPLATAEADLTVRRVCIQRGVPTYSTPDRKARVARSRSGPPSRLGGGEYVQLTGGRAAGYHQVSTLERVTL